MSGPKAQQAADGGRTRGGDRQIDASTPVRTCIVTREKAPPDELIRFVLDPAGNVVPDVARKLPGRGVWVGLSRATLETAMAGKSFARAFRRPVTVPADLVDLVDHLLHERACQALSLANKSGLVRAGFTKVAKALDGGDVAVLVHGADAAGDGRDRLDRKHRAIAEASGRTAAVVDVLTIADLSLAIGRANVVHASVRDGRSAANFVKAAERVLRFRGAVPSGRSVAGAEAARG